MSKRYLYRKQTCHFNVNLDLTLDAIEADQFKVDFEIEIEEDSKSALLSGIKKVWEESQLAPHLFIIETINVYSTETPPLAFEMCARGAAKLILGISNEEASYPFKHAL